MHNIQNPETGGSGGSKFSLRSRRVPVFWSLFGVLEVKGGLDRTGKRNR